MCLRGDVDVVDLFLAFGQVWIHLSFDVFTVESDSVLLIIACAIDTDLVVPLLSMKAQTVRRLPPEYSAQDSLVSLVGLRGSDNHVLVGWMSTLLCFATMINLLFSKFAAAQRRDGFPTTSSHPLKRI
jgi:hypothetical protein